MNEQGLFSYSNYETQTYLAERELAEFIKAVTERLGPEQGGPRWAIGSKRRTSLTPLHFRSAETGMQLRLQLLRACQIMSMCRSIVRFLSEPIPIRKYRL